MATKVMRKCVVISNKNGGPVVFAKTPNRNDKCHCNSDKKYKNCCMLSDEQKLMGK